RLADGRYSFYLTKTKTVRKASEVDQKVKKNKRSLKTDIEFGRGIHLDFKRDMNGQMRESGYNQVHIGIDIDKVRKNSTKMDTIHFRVDPDLKIGLDKLCKREGIKAS